jgi:hypothetical protein
VACGIESNHHENLTTTNHSFYFISAMTLVLLGAAWTFAIFAGTTITNVPNVGTHLYGDIGTFPGSAIDGFPPGIVDGNTYSAGAYAGIVVGDIRIAYNNATGQPFTQTLTDTDLGGLTLTPGVYKFDDAAALSAGQLFFDAQGDVDAVWIFQIVTSLNVASGTGMFFTSGLGNANNVFWAVGSSATLKEDVSFIGNILAYTSISCNALATVNGRLLGTNGAVTLSQNVVSFPGGPTMSPTTSPTVSPSVSPTFAPSAHPSTLPSASPSVQPTLIPSASPSVLPSASPSVAPTVSAAPSVQPTLIPSAAPSVLPSVSPSAQPTLVPSPSPSVQPSPSPSVQPTLVPSASPSINPTLSPTVNPTMTPSSFPTTLTGKKNQSKNNGISHSNLILASVLGSIGGLIVVGSIIGGIVYLTSPHPSGGSAALPQNELPMQEMNPLRADSVV